MKKLTRKCLSMLLSLAMVVSGFAGNFPSIVSNVSAETVKAYKLATTLQQNHEYVIASGTEGTVVIVGNNSSTSAGGTIQATATVSSSGILTSDSVDTSSTSSTNAFVWKWTGSTVNDSTEVSGQLANSFKTEDGKSSAYIQCWGSMSEGHGVVGGWDGFSGTVRKEGQGFAIHGQSWLIFNPTTNNFEIAADKTGGVYLYEVVDVEVETPPTTNVTYTYEKVTQIESGENYIIANGTNGTVSILGANDDITSKKGTATATTTDGVTYLTGVPEGEGYLWTFTVSNSDIEIINKDIGDTSTPGYNTQVKISLTENAVVKSAAYNSVRVISNIANGSFTIYNANYGYGYPYLSSSLDYAYARWGLNYVSNRQVYLYKRVAHYESGSTGGYTEVEETGLQTDIKKSVKSNEGVYFENGVANIELEVAGQQKDYGIDVVLITDVSNSMDWSMQNSGNSYDAVKVATKSLTTSEDLTNYLWTFNSTDGVISSTIPSQNAIISINGKYLGQYQVSSSGYTVSITSDGEGGYNLTTNNYSTSNVTVANIIGNATLSSDVKTPTITSYLKNVDGVYRSVYYTYTNSTIYLYYSKDGTTVQFATANYNNRYNSYQSVSSKGSITRYIGSSGYTNNNTKVYLYKKVTDAAGNVYYSLANYIDTNGQYLIATSRLEGNANIIGYNGSQFITSSGTISAQVTKLKDAMDAASEFAKILLGANDNASKKNKNTLTFVTFAGHDAETNDNSNAKYYDSVQTVFTGVTDKAKAITSFSGTYFTRAKTSINTNKQTSVKYYLQVTDENGEKVIEDTSDDICNRGNTNYDYGFYQGYQAVKSIMGTNYDSNRKIYVVFMTDGAPTSYNGYRADGSNAEYYVKASNDSKTKYGTKGAYTSGSNTADNWLTYLKSNSNENATTLYNKIKDYGTLYSVGFDFEHGGFGSFSYNTSSRLDEVLQGLVSGQKITVENAKSSQELIDFYTELANQITYSGTGAFVVDNIGEKYTLQQGSTVGTGDLVLNGAKSDMTVTITDADGKDTPLETVKFKDDGTVTSTVKGDDTNIKSVDGTTTTISAKYFTYTNANGNEKIVWNIGNLGAHTYKLNYYIYLKGALEGTATASDMDFTNGETTSQEIKDASNKINAENGTTVAYDIPDNTTYKGATLTYIDDKGATTIKTYEQPSLTWDNTQTVIEYYLVDEDGNVVDEEGNIIGDGDPTNPVTFAQRIIVQVPVTTDSTTSLASQITHDSNLNEVVSTTASDNQISQTTTNSDGGTTTTTSLVKPNGNIVTTEITRAENGDITQGVQTTTQEYSSVDSLGNVKKITETTTVTTTYNEDGTPSTTITKTIDGATSDSVNNIDGTVTTTSTFTKNDGDSVVTQTTKDSSGKVTQDVETTTHVVTATDEKGNTVTVREETTKTIKYNGDGTYSTVITKTITGVDSNTVTNEDGTTTTTTSYVDSNGDTVTNVITKDENGSVTNEVETQTFTTTSTDENGNTTTVTVVVTTNTTYASDGSSTTATTTQTTTVTKDSNGNESEPVTTTSTTNSSTSANSVPLIEYNYFSPNATSVSITVSNVDTNTDNPKDEAENVIGKKLETVAKADSTLTETSYLDTVTPYTGKSEKTTYDASGNPTTTTTSTSEVNAEVITGVIDNEAQKTIITDTVTSDGTRTTLTSFPVSIVKAPDAFEPENNDQVVIDYGKPILIDVLANDPDTMILNKKKTFGQYFNAMQVVGFVEYDGEHNLLNILSSKPDYVTTYTSDYGTFTINDNKVEYKLSKMLSEVDQVYSVVKLTKGTRSYYIYEQLDVIPATVMYYETDFVLDNTGSSNNDVINVTNGSWSIVGTGDADYQDDGTIGLKTLPNGEQGYQTYGYDTSYLGDSGLSDGTSYYIYRSPTDKSLVNAANFTFTGTGFDLISRTGTEQGIIRVTVYKADKTTQVKRVTVSNKSDSSYELYQIPVVSIEGLEYGSYYVVIDAYCESNNGTIYRGGQFHFDAIRVYDPIDVTEGAGAEDGTDAKITYTAYYADKEADYKLTELRDLLVYGDSSITSDATVTDSKYTEDGEDGILFVDLTKQYVSLATYKVIGPDNEIYLTSTEALAFSFDLTDITGSVDLGMKAVSGDAQVQVTLTDKNGTQIDQFEKTIESTTVEFYDLFDGVDYAGNYDLINVTIKNLSANTLSITDLKTTMGSVTIKTSQTAAQTAIEHEENYDILSATVDTVKPVRRQDLVITVTTSTDVDHLTVLRGKKAQSFTETHETITDDDGEKIVWTVTLTPSTIGIYNYVISAYGSEGETGATAKIKVVVKAK